MKHRLCSHLKGFNWEQFLKCPINIQPPLCWIYHIDSKLHTLNILSRVNLVLIVGNAILTNTLRTQWGVTRKGGKVPLASFEKTNQNHPYRHYFLHDDQHHQIPYLCEGWWIGMTRSRVEVTLPRSSLVSFTRSWINDTISWSF